VFFFFFFNIIRLIFKFNANIFYFTFRLIFLQTNYCSYIPFVIKIRKSFNTDVRVNLNHSQLSTTHL